MRCVEIREPGGPEVLVLVERPDPIPGPGEVLIAVAAAGVNRPDALRNGVAATHHRGVQAILRGLEVSGTVLEVGEGVPRSRIGEAVCALLPGGGDATGVSPQPSCACPFPRASTIASSAGLPETCFTVWTNVFDRGRLAAGETALFHGGSSGIGTTAIQMAAARGARAIVTAGSDEKCQTCLDLGAFAAINYRDRDFVGRGAPPHGRPRRRPHPAHRGRVLRAPNLTALAVEWPPGADWPDGGGARGAGGFPEGAGAAA